MRRGANGDEGRPRAPRPSKWKRRQYRPLQLPLVEELAPPGYRAVCPGCGSGDMVPTLAGELWSTYDCRACRAEYVSYYDCLHKIAEGA